MAVGLQMAARRTLLTRLKNDAPLNALVPASSIDPDGPPAWPFIGLRAPVTQLRQATGLRGGQVALDAHAFAGARKSAGSVVETAEDHAGRIGAAIESALHAKRFALEDGGAMRVMLSDIRLLEDGDPDHYHWFCQVNCRMLTA